LGTVQSNRRWWVLAAVSLATFMTYLDNNVVNVALPTIQRDLGLSIAGLEWIVSGYILVFAGLMLAGGRLADVYGRRRVFLAGLGLFTLASLLAGVAGSEATLLVGRVLQGGGAALLTPAALAILPATFTNPRERNTAVGIWSAVGALALAFGPLTGGFISQHWHWGWIYLVNVPIGAATTALAAVAIREPAAGRALRRLDLPGLVTSSVSLVALTYALIEGERHGWTSGLILGAFAASIAAAVAFVLAERRSADPMMDLSLFRSRLFSGGTAATGLWSFGIFGIYFFTALYLQNVLGFSPTRAGAAFVPMALVLAVVAGLSGPVAARVGTHLAVAGGLAMMAAAVVGLSGVDRGAGLGQLMPWFLLYGVGGGLLVPLTATILGQLPADREGVASGVLNVSREVFGLLGVTVLGAILGTRQSARLRSGADAVGAFLSAYQFTLLIAAAIVAVGVPVSLYALRLRQPGPAAVVSDDGPGAVPPAGAHLVPEPAG
jgi:EmrB/QacA subfamily drug resistance transporter